MLIHVLLLLVSANIFEATSERTSNVSVFSENAISLNDQIIRDTDNDSGTTNVMYGSEGIITCDIRSSGPLHIHWYYIDETTGKINQIISSDKYWISTNGTELRIKRMDLDMTGEYICTAAYGQKVGIVLMAPNITGKAETKAVRGSDVVIECTIIKGLPEPNITWEYKDQSNSTFTLIPNTGNVLRLSNVTETSVGRYKCVAVNLAGKDEHVTTLVVEFPPRIVSKSSTVYGGLVGDIALRISCDVVGTPQATNTWKINGNPITPNEKYSIEDGALIIMNPTVKDSSSYTCEAKNYLGSVNETFKAYIEELIHSLEINSRYVYLLKGETRKLQCEGYNSTSQSVRWFIEDVEVGSGKPYLEVTKATFNDDGNYTCRVNDKHGHTHTHTYVVDIGYPPKLYELIPVNNWRGDAAEIFSNCDSTAKPESVVEWEFNGKVLTYQNLTQVGDSFKWGHYKCNVTNVHGSVLRSFDVESSACFINRKLEGFQNMPLLLTNELTYPGWDVTKHDLIVEPGNEFTLHCPHQNKEAMNTFQKFPKQRKLKAFCHKQDVFLVDDKSYSLSDLLCNHNIQPSVVRKNVKCLTETSEWIRVGYNVSGFLETYKVCFDHAKNIPLYTRALVTETDGSLSTAYDWYSYPGIGDGKMNRGFTCKHSNSTCCYSKTQIVNPSDFKYSSAKKTTFFDFLNTVPYWRPCPNRIKMTWEDIDEMVRSQQINYGDFVVWSGTHTLQDEGGAFIPRYLWKVVVFDENTTIAIVHVNDPKPTNEDIKCEDISSTDDVSNWFIASDKFTYCCSVPSFIEAFGMHGIDFIGKF